LAAGTIDRWVLDFDRRGSMSNGSEPISLAIDNLSYSPEEAAAFCRRQALSIIG
jgi:hypothetical protein